MGPLRRACRAGRLFLSFYAAQPGHLRMIGAGLDHPAVDSKVVALSALLAALVPQLEHVAVAQFTTSFRPLSRQKGPLAFPA